MGIDGIAVRGVQRELERELPGARVTRIYQPLPDAVVLRLRRPAGEYDLLCSSHARFARTHLTSRHYSNPVTPPPFCMLLRKHLDGARLASVEQPGLERIVRFVFEPVGPVARAGVSAGGNPRGGTGRGAEMSGARATLVLVVEMMGRHSNVILVDGATGRILDGMKRIDSRQSRYREVAPGERYAEPPPQGKTAPEAWTFDAFEAAIRHAPPEARLPDILVDRVDGLGPSLAEAIVRAAKLSPKTRRRDAPADQLAFVIGAIWNSWKEFRGLYTERRYRPTLVVDRRDGRPVDLLPFTFGVASEFEARETDNFSALFDVYFGAKAEADHFRREADALEQQIQAALKRVVRRLKAQRRDMEATRDMERYRVFGELLTANLYRMSSAGTDRVTVPNYYDPEQAEIEIPLDPRKTPSENAQAFFKRYAKLKNRSEQLAGQIERGAAERRYLESLLTHLSLAESPDDLAALRHELVAEGYVKSNERREAGTTSKRKRRAKAAGRGDQEAGRPSAFRSSDGFHILAGRNNRQNDRLTLRTGRPGDLWLHTKEIPGSHVLLRTEGADAETIPDRTVEEAAVIAAYFSKGRDSVNVPVDVTERRHVRKPAGAKPGMVIYDHHRTRYVTPDETLVERLREKAR